jgi:fumarylacetoacetase
MQTDNTALQHCGTDLPENADFSIYNLPFGIVSFGADEQKRAAVRIGNKVIDLEKMRENGLFSEKGLQKSHFCNDFLNDFIALGKSVTTKVRNEIAAHLQNPASADAMLSCMHEVKSCINHLPVKVGDYTDFYSSIEHATNVGKMFRPDNPLLPNWKHIPIGYHGRASSIVISGTNLHRPKGQMLPQGAEKPVFGVSKLMDFELEVAFIVGKNNPLGDTVSVKEAEDYIFGFVLFNDWSARDIQSWEYQPLGPFLGKNFGSSVSPWVVTIEALEPFRTASPVQDPEVLPYLQFEGNHAFDLNLEVFIQPEGGEENLVCRSNFKYMYWNVAQHVAHHTINGCNLQVGDMCASGTISGSTPDSFGSMLELTWRGAKPLTLKDGSERKFINDNDTVIMRGFGSKDGIRVGFGEVSGKILPAKGI